MNKGLRDSLSIELKKHSQIEWTESELDHFITKALYDTVKETQEELAIDELNEFENAAVISGAFASGLHAVLIKEMVKATEFKKDDFDIEFTPEMNNLATLYNLQVDDFDNKIKDIKLNKRIIKIERR